MSVEISVVVCTYNRAGYLRKSLSSLRTQSFGADRFEVVVVDNGSSDATRSVVESEFSRLNNLRYVQEPTLGVARARNAGWEQARGRLVAFLDDDAIAEPDWLEKIFDFFETTDPEPGMVGGKVEPIWESPRPGWLSDDLARALTIIDWPVDGPAILEEHQWVAAANLVFPRDVLREIGGCRTDLGRQGDRLISNEENLLRCQVEELGRECYYHPGIRVAHHAHAARLTKTWFKKRLYWQGVSEARMECHLEPRAWLIRGLLGLKSFLKMSLSPRFLRACLRDTDVPEEFKKQCLARYRIGYAAGRIGIENWIGKK